MGPGIGVWFVRMGTAGLGGFIATIVPEAPATDHSAIDFLEPLQLLSTLARILYFILQLAENLLAQVVQLPVIVD